MTLPPDLSWHPRDIALKTDTAMVLLLGTKEVALVSQRIDGVWISTVNRHIDDWRRQRSATHPSKAYAMRMAERWAVAQLDRIRADLSR